MKIIFRQIERKLLSSSNFQQKKLFLFSTFKTRKFNPLLLYREAIACNMRPETGYDPVSPVIIYDYFHVKTY